jgi:hypothetical protein
VKQKDENVTPSAVPAAWVLGDSTVTLWGLGGAERLERQLRAQGIHQISRGGSAPATHGTILLLRSDYLFDARMLQKLAESPAMVFEVSSGTSRPVPVAANVDASVAGDARAALEGSRDARTIAGVTVRDVSTIEATYLRKVFRANQPRVLAVTRERQAALERYLFDESYKGVTDVVTKFVWPLPARLVVGMCARYGIVPNAVTAVSLVLVVLAGWLFTEGRYLEGLAAGWVMTFLDTVDGKLARVTIKSSTFGHLLDHGIDLIHPPLWYVAWAVGLAGGLDRLGPLEATLWWIFGGYVGGRLVEWAFNHLVGGFSLFSWQPFDSFFRLFTGRRNPNMVLLTAGALAGRPDLGLAAVAAWTVLSTLVLVARLGQGVVARTRGESLRPWLEQVGPDSISRVPRYARPFLFDPGARLAASVGGPSHASQAREVQLQD